MFVMSAFALAMLALPSLEITLGTTSVASKPMMTMTTISSASVNPARDPCCVLMIRSLLSSSYVAHLQDGEDDGPHDEADHDRQDDDHDRLQHGGDAFGDDLDLLVVGVGDVVEHLLQLARLLAHRHHVAHARGKG